VPFVVKWIALTPEPEESVADSVTDCVPVPPPHGPGEQEIELAGAVESGDTVNDTGSD